jgi:ERCC4-type nuclease
MTEDIRHKKVVDAREPSKFNDKFDSIRTKLLEIGWVREALYCGDYSFWTINYKSVGLERKTIEDFFASIGQRLSDQLYRMLEHYNVNILLLEGSWQVVSNQMIVVRGIEQHSWTMTWNYLQTWQDRGLTLQFVTDEGHTIKRLNELYAYYQDNVHTGGVTKNIVGDPRLLAFQCGGIGPKIGHELLKKFGSIKAVANASIEEYLDIEKIGKSRAQRLYDHFNKENSK